MGCWVSGIVFFVRMVVLSMWCGMMRCGGVWLVVFFVFFGFFVFDFLSVIGWMDSVLVLSVNLFSWVRVE